MADVCIAILSTNIRILVEYESGNYNSNIEAIQEVFLFFTIIRQDYRIQLFFHCLNFFKLGIRYRR